MNFNIRVKIGGKSFIVPIRKGNGIWNLRIKNDWFLILLQYVNLPEGSTFIDVGVNTGQTILKFRSRFDHSYIGFEPNANCVNYVRVMNRINGFKNISIFPVGLSDKDEIVVLHTNNDIGNCATEGTIINDLRPTRYTEKDNSFVPVFKFDDINHLKPIERVSMIKIDVEGAELEVITGMADTIKRFQPLIVCEVLDYNSDLTSKILQDRANKLYNILQDLDYQVYLINHISSELKFEKKSSFELIQWTTASLDINDYLFVPHDHCFIDFTSEIQ